MHGIRFMKVALVTTLLLATGEAALAAERHVQLQTRPGVTQDFLVTSPAGAPVASVILFTGGSGILPGTMKNFLIRSRGRFAEAGFLVASVDVPSDHKGGLNAVIRSSAKYAQDIAFVIAWLRQQAGAPVWLIGTSTGTISAASVAARLKTGGPDGLVMTSTFVPANSPPPGIEATVDVASIRIPTLFVHNRDDACETSRFANLAPLIARFTHTPKKELVVLSGGAPPQSEPCESFARHGYTGIEDEAVRSIVNWIKATE